MRKAYALVLSFAFVVFVTTPVLAGELPKPIHKLTNGTVEIVKSPMVIYDHTKAEVDKSDLKAFGLFKGLVTSPFHMVKKVGGGVLDIATFPIE